MRRIAFEMQILNRKLQPKRRLTEEEREIADADLPIGTAEHWEGVEKPGSYHDQLRVGFEMLDAYDN